MRRLLIGLLVALVSPLAAAQGLTGTGVAQSYKDLFHIYNSNTGVDATLRQVRDGAGNSLPLWLSTSKVGADLLDVGAGYGDAGDGGLSIAADGTLQTDGAVTLTGALTSGSGVFGGGFGSTGCSISAAGVLQCDGALSSAAGVTAGTTVTGATLTDGTISIASGGVTGTWADLGTITTLDIDGGTVDGATIGGSSAGAGTFAGLASDTLAVSGGFGATGLSVAAGGAVTTNGAISSDGAVTGASLTDGTVSIASGSVTGTWADLGSITTADINGGTIDGVPVAGSTGAFTTLTGDTLAISGGFGDTGLSVAAGGALTTNGAVSSDGAVTGASLTDGTVSIASGTVTGTWADLSTVTTVDVDGGSVDGATVGLNDASTGAFTTLTATTATATTDLAIPHGAAPAATCAAGEVYLDTDETDDTNCSTAADNSLCLCESANNWVSLETGGGAGAFDTLAISGGYGDTGLSVAAGGALTTNSTILADSSITGGSLTDGTVTIDTGSVTGTWVDLGSVTTIDVNGGTVDGVTVGGASAGVGTFTTLNGTTITASTDLAMPSGDAPAATCAQGEVYLDRNPADDTNCTTSVDNSLCLCESTNSWVALESGSPAAASYGSMSENGDPGNSIAVGTGGNFYGWTNATTGEVAGAGYVTYTNDATADRLTIGASGGGVYMVHAAGSFLNDNSAHGECCVFDTGTELTGCCFTHSAISGTDRQTGSCSTVRTLSANDYLDIRCTSDGNGDDVDVYRMSLSAHRMN